MPTGNPFVIGLLATGERLCDRDDEIDRIVTALREPGAKLVVYGERRLGKSSALEEAARRVRRRRQPVAVASLATASDAADAAHRLLRAVQGESGRSWKRTLLGIVERLRLTLELGPTPASGGLPTFRVSFGLGAAAAPARLLPDVLDAVDAQMAEEDRHLGVALDEFQRLHEWSGEDGEWALREAFQRHEALSYVLAGSSRHLIEAMVTGRGRALWKQVDVLPFGPIAPELLGRWIYMRAEAAGIPFTRAAAEGIVDLAYPRTRDVVQLARAAWEDLRGGGEEGVPGIVDAMERLVREQAALHERVWSSLQPRQQMLLRLFATEDAEHLQITSEDTLRSWSLGAKSTVQSAVQSLVDAEHLVRHGAGSYAFDDPFFRRWVQLFGLPDLGLPVPALAPRRH
jgi:hypothetical protein